MLGGLDADGTECAPFLGFQQALHSLHRGLCLLLLGLCLVGSL